MVNWNYLRDNITQIEINTTMLTNPYEVTRNIIDTSNEVTTGYLGIGILLPIFLVILFFAFKSDGDIRMDITRSIMWSSGFVSIIGVIMLVSNIITSFTHVMWFLSIFIISIIAILFMKKKNL